MRSEVGTKLTLMAQVLFAATTPTQLSVSTKAGTRDVLLLIVMPVTSDGTLRLLVNVMVRGALLLPIGCGAKAIDSGVRDTLPPAAAVGCGVGVAGGVEVPLVTGATTVTYPVPAAGPQLLPPANAALTGTIPPTRGAKNAATANPAVFVTALLDDPLKVKLIVRANEHALGPSVADAENCAPARTVWLETVRSDETVPDVEVGAGLGIAVELARAVGVGVRLRATVGVPGGAGDEVGRGVGAGAGDAVGRADALGVGTAVGAGTAVAVVSGVGVGTAVGAGDGLAVGTGVGVGALVGTGVGLGPGVPVGVRTGVGTGVRLGVGTAVGAGDGLAVGTGVGTWVGVAVGEAVGIGVGVPLGVGMGVGALVGTGVGLGPGVPVGVGTGVGTRVAVGVAVGASVCSMSSFVTVSV